MPTGFSYNTSRNMLNGGAHAYAYNAESEIKSAAGVNYTYDGDGNRIEKSSGKMYWYGAGTEILDESDTSGHITNEYVLFGRKRIAMRNVLSGTIYYYEDDMLGSAPTMVQAGQTSVCYDGDLSERSFLECFQHLFAEMRHESPDSLNLNFAHGTARHDYALAALGNAWRLVNENMFLETERLMVRDWRESDVDCYMTQGLTL